MEIVALLALPLLVGAAAVGAVQLLRRPAAGFLLLALAAPVSHFLEVESRPGQLGPGLKVMHLVALAIFLGVAVRMLQAGTVRLDRRVAPHVGLIFVLMTWAFVVGGFSAPRVWLTQVGSLALFVAIFYLYHRAGAIRRWFRWFALSVGAANLVVLAVAVALPGVAKRHFFSAGSQGMRLEGGYENANQLAGPQVLAFSVLLYYAIHARGRRRWMAVLAALSCMVVALGTQSRSGIGALALTIVLLAGVLVRDHVRALKPLLVATAVGGLFVLAFLNLPKNLGEYELARVESQKVDLYDLSLGDIVRERFWIFVPVARTLADRPLGLGYSHHPTILWEEQATYRQPHNALLKNLLNYGILGGLYFNALYWVPPILVLFFAWRRRLTLDSLSVFVAAGMLAYLAHSLFHSATQWIYVWMVWGFGLRLAQLELRAQREGRRAVPARAAAVAHSDWPGLPAAGR